MSFSRVSSSAENMLKPFTHCQTYQTSVKSEIISILEGNALNTNSDDGILIGSRAARHGLPNFRGINNDETADWDIMGSSSYLLEWLSANDKLIHTINLIIPTSDDDYQLDLYVHCTLQDDSKYDFVVPRSLKSYTAYLLNHSEEWTRDNRVVPHSLKCYTAHLLNHSAEWTRNNHRSGIRPRKTGSLQIASSKLLLILKKYMLYYPHQWEKTAKDYYQLLTVTDPLTDEDMILRDLFIQYNEKLHGKRPPDAEQFVVDPPHTSEGMVIVEKDFLQGDNDQRISLIYRAAMLLSYAGDILIGLEHICTQSPGWLSTYVIENWMAIHREKFKQKRQLIRPCIQFEIDNHRLFADIPEIATKRILHFLTNAADFHSMQFVCKRWYTILREDIFWRDLYISRYGAYSGQMNNIKSWKMLYLIRVEGKHTNNATQVEQLLDATIELRQYTSNDILQLWEYLTYENQSVESVLLSGINRALSNSFYYGMEKISNHYAVQLIIIGLEHERSRSQVIVKMRFGEYGCSSFTEYMEELSVQYCSNDNQQRADQFLGPILFPFYLGEQDYINTESTFLSQTPSTICNQYPSGLLFCLFIMMAHPDHRAQFIKYLKNLKTRCMKSCAL